MRIGKEQPCRAGNYLQWGTCWCQVTLGGSVGEFLWSITHVRLCASNMPAWSKPQPSSHIRSSEEWRKKFWLMNVRECKTCPWDIWSKPCVSSQHPTSHKPIRWSHPAPHSVYILHREGDRLQSAGGPGCIEEGEAFSKLTEAAMHFPPG